MTFLKSSFLLLTLVLLTHFDAFAQIEADTLRSVKMTALADNQAINLTIQWKDDPGNNSYTLYKKLREDTAWGDPLIVTSNQDTSYLDTDIEEGELYEYQIVKVTGDTLGYAYLLSGVNYTPPQIRGDVLLVVDSTAAILVQENLTSYMNVLTSEGWKPSLVSVSTAATAQEVKSIILEYYSNLDSLSAVLLMGDIAVPRSGDIFPDNHSNHKGAWPADVYYGDIDGVWTDETVNYAESAYPKAHNIPGDGKFDQDYIPGEVELAIGRMDFSELPVFDLDEYELLDRYLLKNIAYRTGQYRPRRRAIFTNYNPWSEGLGQNAIRNFVPIVSNDSLRYGNILDAFDNSYLWSYFGSSGYMMGANGLGTSSSFAASNFQATFSASFGSTYGDYDFENNFLRSVIASGKTLSTAWVGAPSWHFHPMGLGMDLGYCTLLSQNNTGIYYPGLFAQYVTINLLGDPTLKAFVVRPPANLLAVQNGNHVNLSWSPSEDEILGYQVYKKGEGMDYFEALTLNPITGTNFIDSCIIGGSEIQYIVKAVKREITASGSFINHSSSPIESIQTTPNILPEAEFDLMWSQDILTTTNFSINADTYQWLLSDGTNFFEESLDISFTQNGELTVTLIATNDCFSDSLQRNIIITNTNDLEEVANILVYPNPTRHTVFLENTQNIDELRIYDVLGNQIFVKTNLAAGTHSINMHNQVNGIYFLSIHIDDQVIPKMILLNK